MIQCTYSHLDQTDTYDAMLKMLSRGASYGVSVSSGRPAGDGYERQTPCCVFCV
jgi:hypothetical protein